SHRNYILTGSIVLLVLATAASGTAWVVLALQAGTYEHLLRITPLTIAINALSTTADIIITSTLCYMLAKTRPTSLQTESVVNRLILFTINTGLLTSFCAVLSLIFLIVSPRTLIYAAFYFCIGRLYSNALLASLNARAVIRGRINDVDNNFRIKTDGSGPRSATQLSMDVFARQDESAAGDMNIAVRVQRETKSFMDDDSFKKGTFAKREPTPEMPRNHSDGA
ncbi:unnamed protein product, partial [Mycena citricolor]